MTIHWFPGHMAKTLKNMKEKMKLVDIIIEVVDARIPMCSRNPELFSLLENKKRILAINKSDMVLVQDLEKWLAWFKNKGESAVAINSKEGHGISHLIKEVKLLGADIIEKAIQRGIRLRPIRIMVVGIPNVGKSSLINRIAGRAGAIVQNKPGVTKGYQWIKVREDIELLDTPGVLWPKIQDEECGYKLAITGAIKDDVFLKEDVAKRLIRYLMVSNPKSFVERYQINITSKNIDAILYEIAKKRGCIVSENNIDLSKASEILINDYRNGKLGKVILELPLE